MLPVTRALIALLLLAPLARGAEPVLRTLAGTKVEGELVSVSDKEIVVRGSAGPVTTPVQEVLDLELGTPAAALPDSFSALELTDGSVLHGTGFALKGGRVEFKLL